ncbi:MAG: hypothetical protein AAGK02_04750 [Pseudomonadota bacterium]
MHKVISYISAALAIGGAICMAAMFYAAFNNGGMAVLGLQVFGIIGSVAALVLGFLAKVLSKDHPTPGAAKLAIGLGGLSLLSLVIGFVTIG